LNGLITTVTSFIVPLLSKSGLYLYALTKSKERAKYLSEGIFESRPRPDRALLH